MGIKSITNQDSSTKVGNEPTNPVIFNFRIVEDNKFVLESYRPFYQSNDTISWSKTNIDNQRLSRQDLLFLANAILKDLGNT